MIERIRTPEGGRFDRDHGPTPVEGYGRQGISGSLVIGRSGERMPSRSAAAEAEKKRRWREKRA